MWCILGAPCKATVVSTGFRVIGMVLLFSSMRGVFGGHECVVSLAAHHTLTDSQVIRMNPFHSPRDPNSPMILTLGPNVGVVCILGTLNPKPAG